MSDYRPISCALHSEYELAIIRREPLRIIIEDPDNLAELEGVPLDIFAREGAEFLLLGLADGSRRELRLDRLGRVVKIHSGQGLAP